MLEHLLEIDPELFDDPDEFVPVEKVAPADLLDAQTRTVDWLKDFDAPTDAMLDAGAQVEAARKAFKEVALSTNVEQQRAALTALRVPEAVQHLVGMLSAYDWEFIEQAKQLRGYAMAKIVEETKHNDARIRLKALQMLGNVTEVGLFTERIEIGHRDLDEAALRKRLDEKLSKILGPSVLTPADGATVRTLEGAEDVTDVELKQVLGDRA